MGGGSSRTRCTAQPIRNRASDRGKKASTQLRIKRPSSIWKIGCFETRRHQNREQLSIAPSRAQILSRRKGARVCARYGDLKMFVAVIDEDSGKPPNQRRS